MAALTVRAQPEGNHVALHSRETGNFVWDIPVRDIPALIKELETAARTKPAPPKEADTG